MATQVEQPVKSKFEILIENFAVRFPVVFLVLSMLYGLYRIELIKVEKTGAQMEALIELLNKSCM